MPAVFSLPFSYAFYRSVSGVFNQNNTLKRSVRFLSAYEYISHTLHEIAWCCSGLKNGIMA